MGRTFVRTGEHMFPLKEGVDATRAELVKHILTHHAKGGYPYHVVDLDEWIDSLETTLTRSGYGPAGVSFPFRNDMIHVSGNAVYELDRRGNRKPIEAEIVAWLSRNGWVEAPEQAPYATGYDANGSPVEAA